MIGLLRFEGKGRGLIAIYILHTLNKKPKSGYEILAEIKEKCGNEWTPSKGTIYPLLGRLEEDGIISVKDTGKRSKNVFELTAEGKNLLKKMRKEKDSMHEKFSRFRFIFAEMMGEDTDIANMLFEIRKEAVSKKDKEKTENILNDCLKRLKAD